MSSMKWLSIFLSCFVISLAAEESACSYDPLYAGTLLAIYPKNAAPGYLSIQPYIFGTKTYGTYTPSWHEKKKPDLFQYELFLSLETGITSFLDISLYVSETYSHKEDQHTFLYGDTSVFLGFQLLQDQKESWMPDLRFLLAETFPTGKYNKLDPAKGGIDGIGQGAYQTSAILVGRKVFYLFPCHPFNCNLNLYYVVSSHPSVKGTSVYGGGEGTKGVAHVGNQTIVNVGIEYSLTQNWVVGSDFHYEHHNKTSFSGK